MGYITPAITGGCVSGCAGVHFRNFSLQLPENHFRSESDTGSHVQHTGEPRAKNLPPDTSGSFRAPISGFHGAYFRFQRLGFDPKSKIKVTVGGRRGKKGREGGRERGRGRERGGDHRPNLHMVNCWMESVELGSTRSTMRANRVTGREKIKGRSFEYVNEWGGRCGGVGPLGGGMSRPYYS